MKTRSIHFKYLILILVLSAMLAISVLIGGFSIYEVDSFVQQHTEEFIYITCSNESVKINDILGGIEKSVGIMESYVLPLLNGMDDIYDTEEQQHILSLAGEMFGNVAVNTDGAVSYYLRFDPEISDGKTGIFYSKLDGSEEYRRLEPTDISLYDRDDIERVGWFWIPYDAGQPVWLSPYFNQNNGILMISYVIPLYHSDRFVGVVGMDFDYTALTEQIHSIRIYDNGFAHLEVDGVVIHNEESEEHGHKHDHHGKDEYLRVSAELDNGMDLVLSACYDDIRQIRYEIEYKIVIAAVLLMLTVSLIVFFLVKKTVAPLQKLTEASTKLADGNYDSEIIHGRTYEIRQLSRAFENMTERLREHEQLQQKLAYHDSLTGLRNATSYTKWVADFDEKLISDQAVFGVAMLDLNYLKETHDTYGHEAGNKLIVTAARIISDTFKHSPVFRIGGDEFLVILQNRDLEDREELFVQLDHSCSDTVAEAEGARITASIAKGFALYDPSSDHCFADVFHRADEQMYADKKRMKAENAAKQ